MAALNGLYPEDVSIIIDKGGCQGFPSTRLAIPRATIPRQLKLGSKSCRHTIAKAAKDLARAIHLPKLWLAQPSRILSTPYGYYQTQRVSRATAQLTTLDGINIMNVCLQPARVPKFPGRHLPRPKNAYQARARGKRRRPRKMRKPTWHLIRRPNPYDMTKCPAVIVTSSEGVRRFVRPFSGRFLDVDNTDTERYREKGRFQAQTCSWRLTEEWDPSYDPSLPLITVTTPEGKEYFLEDRTHWPPLPARGKRCRWMGI